MVSFCEISPFFHLLITTLYLSAVPSTDELKALMLLHGGIYHHYESSRTTHIIASNLPHTKIKKLKGGEKIVKPEWIVESIASGKLLDYKKYLLITGIDNVKPIAKLFPRTTIESSHVHCSTSLLAETPPSPIETRENSNVKGFSNNIDSNSSVKLLRTTKPSSRNTSLDSQDNGLSNSIDFAVNNNHNVDSCLQTISSTRNAHTYPQLPGTNNLPQGESEFNSIKNSIELHVTSGDNSLKLKLKGTSKNKNDTNQLVDATSRVNNSPNPEESHFEKALDSLVTNSFKTVNISAPKAQGASTKTASNEDFLGEFYNNSRLHHLSTMGAMFKQYVNEMREKHDGHFKGKQALHEWKAAQKITREEEDMDETFSPSTCEPVVMHIDMDCFFVSVGTRYQPSLRDEPVAVAHSKGNTSKAREGVDRQAEFDIYKQRTMSRMGLNSENHTRFSKVNSIGEFDSMSEIASCNYKAREFGLKNGTFVGHALKKCPNLKIVPYDFDGYKEVSYCLYNLIAGLTLNIEAVSCDEMYVECTQLLQDVGLTPLLFATYLRETIAKETGCTCSTGFGSNKLQARLATKKAKPNGQFHLTSEIVSGFMLNIPLGDLPGVGHALLYKLNGLGAQTCGDLQRISLLTLQSELGNKIGLNLYNHCRGLDDKELAFEHQRKSVSAEVNYGIRFQNHQEMETFVKQLAGEVEKRLEEVKMKGKCITLKLMVRSAEAPREASKFLGHGVCDYITKSSSLQVYISQASQIFKEVMSIINKLKVDPKEMRGVGIQMSKLELLSKTLPTIDTFFTNKVKHTELENNLTVSIPAEPSTSNTTSPGKKLIFVPDSELVKSPKRKARSPRKKSPKKIGDMKLYLMKAQTKTQVPEDFDRTVFESLPEDIKREVLRSTAEQRCLLSKPTPPPTEMNGSEKNRVIPDNLDESFLNALPEDIRREVLEDLCQQQIVTSRAEEKTPTKQAVENEADIDEMKIDSPTVILDTRTSQMLSSNVSLDEMRLMLREWLCESLPESSDVEMFSNYLTNLVEERKLSQIVVLMRFIQRHINRRESDVWSEAYTGILSCVQSTVVHMYGHELRI